jgi:RNA-directed DNA polymerase
VSIARWNLKEAAGESLVRRTETRHEANATAKGAHIPKANPCTEAAGVYLADISAKFREGRGRNLRAFLEELKPLLRGWAAYFSAAQTRQTVRRTGRVDTEELRCVEWRKWKRGRTRMRRLLAWEREKARASAFNGSGPWWNAGAAHMNAALPTFLLSHTGRYPDP